MPRHLAIGDIHGCYEALRTLCDFIQFQADDVIIPLGDYCDRGPNTHAVIDFLIHLSGSFAVRPLRGNHDIMMLNARQGGAEVAKWIEAGGAATLASYSPFEGDTGSLSDVPEIHWDWVARDLLPFYETDTHFFVHANAYPDTPLAEQPNFMLYWEQFNDPPPHESGKTMVCGHTSQESGRPVAKPHAVCIDTRAYDGGWLSCLHAETGLVWQASEQGRTRQFWLDDLMPPDSH